MGKEKGWECRGKPPVHLVYMMKSCLPVKREKAHSTEKEAAKPPPDASRDKNLAWPLVPAPVNPQQDFNDVQDDHSSKCLFSSRIRIRQHRVFPVRDPIFSALVQKKN
jgi:hypothetical protein